VQLLEAGKPLFLRVLPTEVRTAGVVEDEGDDTGVRVAPGQRVVRAKKVDYVSAYRLARPWLTKLTLTALGLIITLAVIGEVIRPEKQTVFMPGGLSSAHALARIGDVSVAGNCSACHTPWNSVESSKCRACHQFPPHAQNEANPPECFTCHAEHRGEPKLAQNADEGCVGCHANLRAHVKGGVVRAEIASIPSFGDQHPDLVPPSDPDTLRFNHKLHLATGGMFNGEGRREILKCESCHGLKTVNDKADPVAIEFEQHCQRCHRLTFDARFPEAEVPHGGDPNYAYSFVLAAYAGNRDILSKPPAEVRRLLAARQLVAPSDQAFLNADQVFRKKCVVCHDMVSRGKRFTAVAPVIRREWFPGVKFNHATHTSVGCEKCHARARNSALTADVSMPNRGDCTECHGRNAKAAQGVSTCKTCHEYHSEAEKRVVMASLAPAGAGGLGTGGRMLQGILLAVIVILLLVVLVPVGIALFQRLRPERTPPPRQQPPAPVPVPPTSKMAAIKVDLPTDKVAKKDVPGPVPPPSIPQPTTMIVTDDSAETQLDQALPKGPGIGETGGTQMVQWYGLLNCISGPLAGQRFTIEEEGFYIGRDPALATVVIADSKISKRHVRIVPRDGKVWAIDEGSTNGTFLNGSAERVTEVQLKRGDKLILGDNTATFVYQL